MAATVKTLDFSNVKEQGQFNPKRKPAGTYLATIAAVADHVSDKKKENWVFTFVLNNDKRATYPYYCGQNAEQLWKVRNMYLAIGKDVPKKKVKIDPNKLVGKVVGIELEDDEYEGKKKSVIQAVIPPEEVDGPVDDASDTDDDSDTDEDTEEEIDLEEI